MSSVILLWKQKDAIIERLNHHQKKLKDLQELINILEELKYKEIYETELEMFEWILSGSIWLVEKGLIYFFNVKKLKGWHKKIRYNIAD